MAPGTPPRPDNIGSSDPVERSLSYYGIFRFRQRAQRLSHPLPALSANRGGIRRDLKGSEILIRDRTSKSREENNFLREEITSFTVEVRELRAFQPPPTPPADPGETASLRREITSLAAEVREPRASYQSPTPSADRLFTERHSLAFS